MNTKEVGDISEAKVLAALVGSKRKVLVPWGDNSRYDLAIDEDGALARIQVKTGRIKESSIRFSTASKSIRTGERQDYTGQVEYFGVYCPDNDSVYLIPFDSVASCEAEASLRLSAPFNNREYRMAEDYIL